MKTTYKDPSTGVKMTISEEINTEIVNFQNKHGYEHTFVGSAVEGNSYMGFKSKETGEWEYWNDDLTERIKK